MVKRLLLLATLTTIFSLALVACSSPPPPPSATPTPTPTPPNGCRNGGSDEVKVTLQDPAGSGSYLFAPSEMTFNVCDTISFTFEAESEFHTFTVDAIDIEVEGGTIETSSFTFDQAGVFELICIPHEALGMVGKITVQ